MTTSEAPSGLDLPASAYDASAYNGTGLLATGIAMMALTSIFMALRFYTRCVLQKSQLAWDDWLVIPAYLLNLALCSIGIATLYVGGVGHHIPIVYETKPWQLVTLLKCLTAVAYIFFLSELLPRLSVCALYLRIFRAKNLRHMIYGAIAFATAIWITYSVAFSFACRPFAFTWDRTIQGGTCYNANAFYKSVGFAGTAVDVALIIIPLPSIYRLKLPNLQKALVVMIFLTGSLGMVAGIIRMAIFFYADPFQGDTTWGSSELQIWTIVEPGIYLIAACLPVLRPLLVNIAPGWMKNALTKASRRKSNKLFSSNDSKSSKGSKGSAQTPRILPTPHSPHTAHTFETPQIITTRYSELCAPQIPESRYSEFRVTRFEKDQGVDVMAETEEYDEKDFDDDLEKDEIFLA